MTRAKGYRDSGSGNSHQVTHSISNVLSSYLCWYKTLIMVYNIFSFTLFSCLIVLYFLHSTSILSFYIEVVLTLSILIFMMTSSNRNIFRARYWPFARGIHRSPVNSPHRGQWRGAFMFSLICTRNGWVNNHEAGDLRSHRVHYDVTVIYEIQYSLSTHSFDIISIPLKCDCMFDKTIIFNRSHALV